MNNVKPDKSLNFRPPNFPSTFWRHSLLLARLYQAMFKLTCSTVSVFWTSQRGGSVLFLQAVISRRLFSLSSGEMVPTLCVTLQSRLCLSSCVALRSPSKIQTCKSKH